MLIYVFDVTCKDDERDKDMEYYKNCLKALGELSKEANIFCLVHKMDLIPENQRKEVFEEKQAQIVKATDEENFNVTCFKTSIWDETLYKAWSDIVHILLPNVGTLTDKLKDFCDACSADEVVLFEKSTFLVIAYHDNRDHVDGHRFEKISNIIK